MQDRIDAIEEKAEDERVQAEQKAALTRAQTAAPAMPKVKGISTRKKWSAEVTDKMALVKAVAEGRQPLRMLEPNMKVLNQMAVALKDEMRVDGVVAKSEDSMSARAG